MIGHIRRRLVLFYTAVIALLLAVCIGSSYTVYLLKSNKFMQDSLRDYFNEELHEAEEDIKDDISEPEIYRVNSGSSVYNFGYWFWDGRLVHAEEPAEEGFNEVLLKRLQSKVYEDGEIYHLNAKFNHQKRYYMVIKQDLRRDGEIRGRVYVLTDYTSVRQSTKSYIIIAIHTGVLAVLAALLLGNLLAKRSMTYIERSYQKQKQFVSDAAHEFRTPLAVLYSYTELLEYSPDKEKIIADIQDEIRLMNEMVERLLSLARYDNSTVALHKEKIVLNDLVASVVKSMSGLYKDASFKLEEKQKNITVFADEVMLRHLFGILLDNAVKYTGKVKKITVRLSESASKAQIEVSDNGIGIAESDIPHIFDRFWQAEKSRHKNGLGLGLSLADAIVRMHKGNISVRSKLGSGTTFTVTLPEK